MGLRLLVKNSLLNIPKQGRLVLRTAGYQPGEAEAGKHGKINICASFQVFKDLFDCYFPLFIMVFQSNLSLSAVLRLAKSDSIESS
jgi:hypothetical protein